MDILVLNGSPKKKSDTMRLTNAFIKGIASTGQHNIDIVNVYEKEIAPCRGCFGCWKIGDGECVIKDDQNAIIKKLQAADIVIWSFPLYCYAMPSQLKAVLDRTIPLNTLKMVEVNGIIRHVPLCDFSRLHHVVISGSGFPNFEHNFDALELMMNNSFGNLTKIFVPETPLLNIPEAAIVAEPKIARFEEAGKEYVKDFLLSQNTIQELQSLMISKEDYLKNINSN